MEIESAISMLGALAQDTRLKVFRLLVEAGAPGLPAGAMARQLDVPANTLSAHLSVLDHAGLVQSRRAGRSIIYTADYDGVRALLGFLMEDCCRGPRAACAPALDAILPAAAQATTRTERSATR